MNLRRIGVFCGSNAGRRKEYGDAARALGEACARRGVGIVFGAGNIGLMNEVAEAALACGGEVIGVIPRFMLDRGLARGNLTGLQVVETMHERKALMAEFSDGFIALPGGIGTLEEIVEAMTWTSLGIHVKPCALLNAAGYYEGLISFMDHAVREGFLKEEHRESLFIAEEPQAALDAIAHRHAAWSAHAGRQSA
jgi:uncharacterized protein (TIGR00730 family)